MLTVVIKDGIHPKLTAIRPVSPGLEGANGQEVERAGECSVGSLDMPKVARGGPGGNKGYQAVPAKPISGVRKQRGQRPTRG